MKNKKFLLGFAGGFLCCLLAAGIGFQVLGANRNITVNDAIKVEFNGEAFTPRDANGKAVPVFSYDGTTYAPIRALCEAAGMQVDYDSTTRTAKVSTAVQPTPTPRPQPPATPTPDPGVVSRPEGDIGEERAKEIALNHAGLKESEVTFVRVELEWETPSRGEYEVEFYSGRIEYDYEIDPVTGEILSYDYDIDYYHVSDSSTNASSEDISEEQAKEIVLSHAGVSERDAVFVRARIENDDGQRIFELEFYVGSTEYDYELNPITGKILSWDQDIENFHIPGAGAQPNPTCPGPIELLSESRAKEIALKHAPAKSRIIKCELDFDDGKAIYEIEIVGGKDKMEIECELDAVTGDVLKWEIDD